MMAAVPPAPDEQPEFPTGEPAGVTGELAKRVVEQIRPVVVGQEQTVELMLIALACRGHVLLQGVPGVAKTLLARALAATLGVQMRPRAVHPGHASLGSHRDDDVAWR